MNAAAIIPARYKSSRFPGKPLADIAGKKMIERVYRRTEMCELIDLVIVATDDSRIAEEVKRFGGSVRMTDSGHSSGTDRIAEVAGDLNQEFIVNVQGDEPLIRADMIEDALLLLREDEKAVMSTLASPLSPEEADNPDTVKLVRDMQGRALYFSRSPIPGNKDSCDGADFWQHIGLYVFHRDFLLRFTDFEPTPLERREGLEQLRALEHGYEISVGITEHHGPGVDRPEDIDRVENILAQEEIDNDRQRETR